MGLGIIFLMWELGQPYKMFPQILQLAHFLFERGGLRPSWLCLESQQCSFQTPEAQKMLRRKQTGNPQSSLLPRLLARSHGQPYFLCLSASQLLNGKYVSISQSINQSTYYSVYPLCVTLCPRHRTMGSLAVPSVFQSERQSGEAPRGAITLLLQRLMEDIVLGMLLPGGSQARDNNI